MAKRLQAQSIFEQIKQVDADRNEFWSARDLGKVLGYLEYRNFKPVITKAKEACKNSNQDVLDHFVQVHEMVKIGLGAERKIEDIKLSRYACYLIVQNADPSKEVVAVGQTYFAVQTRIQEIQQMEALSWQQIFSAPRKRRRSCGGRISKGRPQPTRRIMKWAKPSAKR